MVLVSQRDFHAAEDSSLVAICESTGGNDTGSVPARRAGSRPQETHFHKKAANHGASCCATVKKEAMACRLASGVSSPQSAGDGGSRGISSVLFGAANFSDCFLLVLRLAPDFADGILFALGVPWRQGLAQSAGRETTAIRNTLAVLGRLKRLCWCDAVYLSDEPRGY